MRALMVCRLCVFGFGEETGDLGHFLSRGATQGLRQDLLIRLEIQTEPLIRVVRGLFIAPRRQIEYERAILHCPITRYHVSAVAARSRRQGILELAEPMGGAPSFG